MKLNEIKCILLVLARILGVFDSPFLGVASSFPASSGY